jgi:protein ImuA
MHPLRLSRAGGAQPAPQTPIRINGAMALRPGRAHEICGPARRSLAAMVAARTTGPVLWIRPSWMAERLNPDGLTGRDFDPGLDPGRLILVAVQRPEDLLWCLEEALRSGAVALAVAELPAPPPLTPVRRLHLAAETGAETGGAPPLGLLLTPAEGGAAGVESRWSLAPAHAPGAPGWLLQRRRARTAPPAAWRLHPDGRSQPVPAPA